MAEQKQKEGTVSYLDLVCVIFFSGSLYELSGYSHFPKEVKLSAYRNGVKGGCAALHTVAKAAHKPGMPHLYPAVEALEWRCKRLERVANSQLCTMVREQVRLY